MIKKSCIIGLFGPPRSGKNTVSEMICQGFSGVPVSISDPMKAQAHRIANMVYTESQKDTPMAELSGKTPRELYIHLGNIDDIVASYWIDKTLERMVPTQNKLYVIESVGKQQQWNRILESGKVSTMFLIDIRREGCEWDSRTPIEDYIDPFILHNNGTINDLHHNVLDIMDYIDRCPAIRYSAAIWQFLNKQGWSDGRYN